MELEVIRKYFKPTYTIGKFIVDMVKLCDTLEDPVRDLQDINHDGDFDDPGEGKIYGETAIPYVLVYDQLGTFLALATYGTFVVSYCSSKTQITFKIITFKVLTFPPFISLIVALFFIGVEFHPVISKVLSSLANTIVPIALVAVGLQLQFKLPKEDLKPFSVALFVKLLVAPIIAIIVCKIFGWNNQASIVSIMEAGMAPMITAGAIASMAGLAPRLSSAIVGYGILISFVTTGIVYKLIS